MEEDRRYKLTVMLTEAELVELRRITAIHGLSHSGLVRMLIASEGRRLAPKGTP